MTRSKYKPYPEYKDSGIDWIGMIPSHWNVVPFFGEVTPCKRSNKGMVEDNLLSLSFGRIIRKDINTGDGLLPASFETYQIVENGDEVFRLTDLQNDHRSLRSARVLERGIITSAYLAVTPRASHIEYFSHLMRSYDATKVFYSMGGGLRQSLKFDDMRRLPVVAPSEFEQDAIANYINGETSRIDRLIEKKERFIELLKEKRQALITHAVTKGLPPEAAKKAGLDPHPPMKDSGIEWIGEVPAHWESKRLSWWITKCGSGTTPSGDQYYSENGIPWVTTGELREAVVVGTQKHLTEKAFLDYSALKLHPEGSLAIAMYGATIGRLGIFGVAAAVNQACFVIHPNKRICIYFLSFWFQAFEDEIINLASGGGQPNINAEKLKQLLIPAPSLAEEQKAIFKFLEQQSNKVKDLIVKTQRSIALLKERRTALITAAVTGQIDVRESA